MASFNKTIIVGTLGRDPEVKYTPGGTAVCDLSLAVNRSWFDKNSNSRKEEVCWVPVTLFGRQAEVASEYLKKGREVLIEGRLKMDEWDDKDTGKKMQRLKVISESMTMLGGKSEGGDSRSPAESFYDRPAAGGVDSDDVPF